MLGEQGKQQPPDGMLAEIRREEADPQRPVRRGVVVVRAALSGERLGKSVRVRLKPLPCQAVPKETWPEPAGTLVKPSSTRTSGLSTTVPAMARV